MALTGACRWHNLKYVMAIGHNVALREQKTIKQIYSVMIAMRCHFKKQDTQRFIHVMVCN